MKKKKTKPLFRSTRGARIQRSQLSGRERWMGIQGIHGFPEQTQGGLSTTETSAETRNPEL